jgi:methyl-accepting chemotaxis protein
MRISIKLKLIAVFSLLVLISAFIGINSYKQIDQTGKLVYTTYDNTLMAGQFAQAVKYDFSKYSNLMQQTLLSKDMTKFISNKKKVRRTFKTLLEDLEVVKDRSLSVNKASLISAIESDLEKIKSVESILTGIKQRRLERKDTKSFDLYESWVANKLAKQLVRDAEKIFDDSAENGYVFRLDSEELIKKNLKATTYATSLGVGLSILFSFIVAFLIIRPLQKLERVCDTVKSGDYSKRSTLKNNDEFGDLSESLNIMLSAIENKDKGMQTLLASLPFGLFYIDEQGLISKERSPMTDEIVPNMKNLTHISDVYEALLLRNVRVMDVVETAYSGMLSFDSAMRLLPSRVDLKERNLEISFKAINDDNKSLLRIIVIIRDITDLIASQRKAKMLENQVRRVSFVSSDISGYFGFVKETDDLLLGFLKTISVEDRLRDLHSIKGLLSLNKFDSTSNLVHQLENDFMGLEEIEISHRVEEIKIDFDQIRLEVNNILRLDNDEDGYYCNPVKINEIINFPGLSEKCKNLAQNLDAFSAEEKFQKYKDFVATMGNELKDKEIELNINAPFDIKLQTLKKLDLSFSHILRNMADHGIEDKVTRRERSKNEKGLIQIIAVEKPDSYHFSVSDDGGGIDGDTLYHKAIERGIIEENENITELEKINLVFVPGLSSKNDVTDLSGRGVGMDAVKDSIEKLGGKITVQSKIKEGTSFDFFIKKESYENIIS